MSTQGADIWSKTFETSCDIYCLRSDSQDDVYPKKVWVPVVKILSLSYQIKSKVYYQNAEGSKQ